MKKIEITFGFLLSFMLTFLMFGMSLSLFAQEEAPTVIKKKIIVKKTIDEDGNESTETIETEVDVNLDLEDIEGEFNIDVDETIENGVRKKIVKVRVDSENGELPQDILDELEALGIDINIIEGDGSKTIIIDADEDAEGVEGEHDIRIFKMGEGEELPEEIRKKLEEEGIDIDKMESGGGHGFRMHRKHGDLGKKRARINRINSDKSTTIDRQTKIFRIADIDDLDKEIIKEIETMGIEESDLRQRFNEAETSVRIYKEGLQPVEIELDAPMAQQQMFFIGEGGEEIELGEDIDLEWMGKESKEEFEKRIEDIENVRESIQRTMPQIGHRIPRIAPERGQLGVTLEEDATIANVSAESAAANAGLEVGDQLLKVGEMTTRSADDVIRAMEKALPGTNVDVTFKRDENEQTVTVIPDMPSPKIRHHKRSRGCSPDDKAHWMKRMKADCEKRCSTPFLGIYMAEKDRDAEQYEVEITGVVQNTGAEVAGILTGDIVKKIGRTPVSNVQEVADAVGKYEPGDVVKVQVLRDGKKKRVKATLGNQTQDDIFSPCDCDTGEVNANAMTSKEIIIIKSTAKADLPNIGTTTKEKLNLEEIDLFPNPNNGKFTIKFVTESKVLTTLSIIDVSGKEVYREVIKDFNGRYDNQIDISNAANGTYFLNIIQGNKVFTEQFVFGNR